MLLDGQPSMVIPLPAVTLTFDLLAQKLTSMSPGPVIYLTWYWWN